uniref:Uncharacterized protein n=1 Tax=viral metagenome TaxID=1070528 RepID=A0A6C0BTH8_9ZZZZ
MNSELEIQELELKLIQKTNELEKIQQKLERVTYCYEKLDTDFDKLINILDKKQLEEFYNSEERNLN